MSNPRHSQQGPEGGTHIVHNWIFADATTREEHNELVSSDLYKIAYQTNDRSWWVLASLKPVEWVHFAGGSSPLLSLIGYAESEDESVSSATDFDKKLEFEVRVQKSGLYLIFYCWETKTNTYNDADHEIRVSLDDDVIGSHINTVGLFDQFESRGGFAVRDLTLGVSKARIEFRTIEPSTVTIRRTRISIFSLG